MSDKVAEIQAKAKELEELILQSVPQGMEQSIAISKLKRVTLHAIAGIRQ